MKWFSLPTVLIVLATSATANADLLDRFEALFQQESELNPPAEIDADPSSSDVVPPPEASGHDGGPWMMKSPHMQSYPFNSCCQDQSSCCDHLWRGYHGKRHCRVLDWFEHCGRAGRCGWGHLHRKHHCGPSCDVCGPKGHGWGLKHAPSWGLHHAWRPSCDPCGRLGLVGLLHARKGHGCGKSGGHCHAKCGCGATGYHHGGSKIMGGSEPSVAPHMVPEPGPIPAPEPENSARLRLFPRSLFQPVNFDHTAR